MLPAANRLTSAAGYRHAVRRGRRTGSRTVVVHHLAGPAGEAGTAQVGFVVSRAVGNAVVRNRVKRRLRHLVRDRLDVVGPGDVVVVRALPAAASASYDDLTRDLGRAFVAAVPA